MTELPLISSAHHYTVSHTLFDVPLIYDVRWNTTDASWYLNIHDGDAAPIAFGLKIALGAIINRRVLDDRMAPALLVALDTSGKGIDATFDDLGTRVVVLAFHYDEVGLTRKYRSWAQLTQPTYDRSLIDSLAGIGGVGLGGWGAPFF